MSYVTVSYVTVSYVTRTC